MKLLDKYVIKSFLIGYVIAFGVLIGLRIVIDLFVNLDEFAEQADLGTLAVLKNILMFYGLNITLYFRDFAGMITVVAAVFSLGKMIRNHELVAVMASGISLKRVIAPIIIISLLLTGLLVIDQEVIIPPLSDQLVRDQDALPGHETYDVWFLNDSKGSLFCSSQFDVQTKTLKEPTIITRDKSPESLIWRVTGRIDARKAVYDPNTDRWGLVEGRFLAADNYESPQPVNYYQSSLTPQQIPVRAEAKNKNLLSWSQLRKLASYGANVKDQAELYYQMHSHVTTPIINFIMLMVALPVLVTRDPKAMKSAIFLSFIATSACMVTKFMCDLLAAEAVFGIVMPEFWAWLPIFIFLPVALIELDSMRT